MNTKTSLRIGIDIDGTVTDPGCILPLLNESYGKNFTLVDCYDYNLAKVYGITQKEFTDWLAKHSNKLYAQSRMHGPANDFLQRWYDCHQLIYISARNESHRKATLDWFSRHQIPYHVV